MTIKEICDKCQNTCILYDGTRITPEFLNSFGNNEVDMFVYDWISMKCVIFPTGCYTADDMRRWNV